MENKNQPGGNNADFTGKGRTSNPGADAGQKEGTSQDISNVDQQEGELNPGTTGSDEHLFENDNDDAASGTTR